MKQIIAGLELSITDADQIINMGGPWIGKLSIGGKFISDNCIVDNFIYNEILNCLFFVKFHRSETTVPYTNHFTINFYNMVSDIVYEFNRVWEIVYLNSFIDDTKLEVCCAFHKWTPNKTIFYLDQENFEPVF